MQAKTVTIPVQWYDWHVHSAALAMLFSSLDRKAHNCQLCFFIEQAGIGACGMLCAVRLVGLFVCGHIKDSFSVCLCFSWQACTAMRAAASCCVQQWRVCCGREVPGCGRVHVGTVC